MAVASSVTASHFRTLIHQGSGPAAALTGGFQWALWFCGLAGLAAIPVAILLIRRAKAAKPAASAQPYDVAAAIPVDRRDLARIDSRDVGE